MKKLLPILLVLLAFTASAQLPLQPAEPELRGTGQYMIQHIGERATWQKAFPDMNNNSRGTVYRNIAYRTDRYDKVNTLWVGTDSARYTYNAHADQLTGFGLQYFNVSWYNAYQYTYMYNSANQYTDVAYENWIPYLNAFRNYMHYIYNYNSTTGLQESQVIQVWDSVGNTWLNSDAYYYTYNPGGSTQLVLVKHYDKASSTWKNVEQTIYTRDANDNTLTSITQEWNGTDWVNYGQYQYTYDANKRNTVQVYLAWSGSAWVNNNKYEYTYSPEGYSNGYNRYTWNTGTSQWDNSYQVTATLNAAGYYLNYLVKYWTSGAWQNYYQYIYQRDANNNATQIDYQLWSTGTSSWTPYNRAHYTYDANANNTYYFSELFNTGNLTYENNARTFYYYQSFDVASVADAPNQLNATLYPNPSTGTVANVQLLLPQATTLAVGLYDAQGRLVLEQQRSATTGTNNISISTGTLPAGTYYIRLADIQTQQTSTLTLVK